MKNIYCDASFDYKHTEETRENFVRGKIAIVFDNIKVVERVVVGKVEGLRQYINILELTAIARAIELASQLNQKPESIAVYTDSMTAMYWARAGKIKKSSVVTPAHESALNYLRGSVHKFAGVITYNLIKREQNPAGHLLEKELEKEPPHSI